MNCEDFWDIDFKPDDLRAPDEKTSLRLKDSSKQGHKTKEIIFIFVHHFRCDNHAS